MRKFVILSAGVLVIVASITTYVLLNRNPEQTDINITTSNNTYEFSNFFDLSLDKRSVNTLAIEVPSRYKANQHSNYVLSIEDENVQLILINPGTEAFSFYTLKSNDGSTVKANDYFNGDLIKFLDRGELKIYSRDKDIFNSFIYPNKYFYIEEAQLSTNSCSEEFGCPGASILIEGDYPLYLLCSTNSENDSNNCEDILLSLKFNRENRVEQR